MFSNELHITKIYNMYNIGTQHLHDVLQTLPIKLYNK